MGRSSDQGRYALCMSALAYFLTWTTYGTWLRSDPRGSVVDENRRGFAYAEPDHDLVAADIKRMRGDAVLLSPEMRGMTHSTINSVCVHRGWPLHAVNARSNHVHAVLTSTISAERTLADLKAWATRRMREAGLVGMNDRVWTTHGSTRHIFDRESLARAVDYVVRHQDMKGER